MTSPKTFTYVWGWSRSQRLRGDNETLVAKNEAEARRVIRERFNLRSTRGISLVAKSTHDFEIERREALRRH